MWRMEPNEILLSKDGGAGGGNNNLKTGDGFIDRSKVRILLCDNDSKSSEEVFTLLCKCSYQVTSVRSPRQVIDALNAEGRDIDIILSEVDLPMAKGFKLLKYIMRDKQLQRIPVIMMSAQDEVSLVVKCLRLGAADYLVKPLRTNELLNLWTHMWRRRRMLGLAEKNIMNCEFDMVPSDPSDANTNSTTLFSDDTDDKSRKNAIPEMSVSIRQGDESDVIVAAGPVDTRVSLSNDQPDMLGRNYQHQAIFSGQIMSGPKKSELKIGHSSAFFTYVKSTKFRSTAAVAATVDENIPQLSMTHDKLSSHGEVDSLNINLNNENPSQHLQIEKEVSPWSGHGVNDAQGHDLTQAQENPSHIDEPSGNSFPDSMSLDQSSTPPPLAGCSQQMNSNMEECPERHMQEPRPNAHSDVSGYNAHSAYPYYLSGVISQVMMSPASSMYHKNMNNLQSHADTAMLPHHFNHVPHPHHIPGMASFPYYPVNLCLQPGQMPPTMHPWPSYGSSPSNDGKVHKIDRREAALLKFRQKRKERCFDKKIRYVNRKKLAERRPRVRGQFVRKINGINVDLNGQPTSADFDDDEEDDEEEEEQAGRDSSAENDSSILHG